MTVSELRKKLTDLVKSGAVDGDMEIVTEGCDCYGDVVKLEIQEIIEGKKKRRLLLCRSDGHHV